MVVEPGVVVLVVERAAVVVLGYAVVVEHAPEPAPAVGERAPVLVLGHVLCLWWLRVLL